MMILFLLVSLCLVSGAHAHESANIYHVRRREGVTTESIHNLRRELADFVPSFSMDGNSIITVDMPILNLLIRGLDGTPLGSKSYEAIETAMNDYMNKRFEDYFSPMYDFKDVSCQVMNDAPAQDGKGGNNITLACKLAFKDPSYEDPREPDLDGLDFGARKRAYMAPAFRSSNGIEIQPRQAVNEGVPSELELELAAGYAWSDLSSFRNHLLVAATIESIRALDGMEDIESDQNFPTSEQTADEIVLAEDEEDTAEEETAEEETVEEVTENVSNSADFTPRPPNRGDITAPSGNTLNVAAASSQLQSSGTDRINPLWPALIVGMAVFLFTIIIIGYRKHKKDPFLFGRDRSDQSLDKDNVMIHVNDNSTFGDEEIEVEDQLYSTPDSTPERKKKSRKQQERDLDKEYAKSCLTPATLVLSSSTPESTYDDEYDDEDSIEGDGIGRKNCFKRNSRKSRNSRSLREQDSMAFDTNNNRGIDLPRTLDLTSSNDSSSWRNPSRLNQEDDVFDGGDLTSKEKKQFSKYMRSGMSVEEASSQIMSEREQERRLFRLKSPSATTRTRSGGPGGYTVQNKNKGTSLGQEQRGEQSSPMDCFSPSLSPCAEQTLDSEVMDDGTNIHFVERPSYDPYEQSSSQRFDGKARAMIITEASSYGSSFDDEEFDRAMEEAAADTTAFV